MGRLRRSRDGVVVHVLRLRRRRLKFPSHENGHWRQIEPSLAPSAAVSLDEASATGAADASTEIISLPTSVGADPDLIERTGAADAKQKGLKARIVLTSEDGAQPLDGTGIHRERMIAIEAGGKLDTPRLDRGAPDLAFKLGDKTIGRAFEQRNQIAAIGARRAAGRFDVLAGRGPVVDRGARNGEHVVPGLLRHGPGPGQPVLHPFRAGIVGRRGETEIAELAP